MNEPDILQAYRDLSTPTSAPADLLATVDRRIRRRRTARRGVAGLAALAVAGGIAVGTLGGTDGDGEQNLVADGGGEADVSTLTATLSDGSTQAWAADELSVACNPDGSRLWLARNKTAESFLDAKDLEETEVETPVLLVELVVANVRPGQMFELPYDSVSGATEDRGFTLFFTADEGRQRDNELSSAEPGSSGTVTVNDFGCGSAPHLDVVVDATLGSEVGQPALAIEGRYRS
jgi:hypothetical protein